jgi:hypothetical protein
MTEQERFEQMFRESQLNVRFSRPAPPLEPPQKPAPQPAQKAAPLPRSCHPLEQVIIADIRLSWNCVARLSLQVVVMSFLVGAMIAGIIAIFLGLAEALTTMPPAPR